MFINQMNTQRLKAETETQSQMEWKQRSTAGCWYECLLKKADNLTPGRRCEWATSSSFYHLVKSRWPCDRNTQKFTPQHYRSHTAQSRLLILTLMPYKHRVHCAPWSKVLVHCTKHHTSCYSDNTCTVRPSTEYHEIAMQHSNKT